MQKLFNLLAAFAIFSMGAAPAGDCTVADIMGDEGPPPADCFACLENGWGACAGDECTEAEEMAAVGNCLADPPADSACTAEEVTVGSAAVAAEEDPEGMSDDCMACVFARTLRKGGQDVATSDIELCGPPAADAAKASSAFATGACLTALVATAVAM